MIRRVIVILALLPALSCSTGRSGLAVGPQNAHLPHEPTSGTRLVLLGTGTPNAEPARSGTALAVVVDGQAYLVDCGPGVVRRAAAAQRAGIDALAGERLTHVFITHLHSDHTLGYPDLIFTPWVLEREVPPCVWHVIHAGARLRRAWACHPAISHLIFTRSTSLQSL